MIDEQEAFAAAQRLRNILTVVLILTVGLVVAATVSGASNQGGMVAAATGHMGWQGPALGRGQQIALVAIGCVHLGFWEALLLIARRIVGRFGTGNLTQAAASAQALTYLLWGLFAWTIVAGALGSVILTWHMPSGERALAIGLSSTQLSLAIAALIAGFMTKAFVLCAALWQDYQEVI